MATTNKYDRQLRLWGSKGQKALSETTVVLIRATAAGTETMKNLVLPGIGRICIVDDVSNVDGNIDSNFFVLQSNSNESKEYNKTFEKKSSSRAEVTMELLRELNPDVQGTYEHVPSLLDMDYEQFLTTKMTSSGNNLLVIGSDLEYPLLMRISAACSVKKVPLIVVQSYGLMGLVRLQSPPIPIIDPKPDNSPPDLRLVTPFPKFIEYCNTITLDDLPKHEHGHVPYPVILYKLGQKWKDSHDNKLPSSYSEKQEFKQTIKDAARDLNMEINFVEAMDNSYLAYTERTVDKEYIVTLLEKAEEGTKFATMLKALLQFLDVHDGAAPLHGALPDMTASTQGYVQLQTLYRDQAQRDVQELVSYCNNENEITEEDVKIFAQNVTTLDLVHIRTLEEEYNQAPTDEILEELQCSCWDPYEIPEHTPLLWYIGLRACQFFYKEEGRFPGTTTTNGTNGGWERDIPILQSMIVKTVKDMKLDTNNIELIQQNLLEGGNENKKFAHELTRYGNAEIHNVASIVGGVASQEAVKLITNQYVPFNNTYVFNGIASVAGVYQF